MEHEHSTNNFVYLIASVRRNWAFILSFGYLYLTTLGMLYEREVYLVYGIDILKFSNVNDFLSFSLRTPFYFMFKQMLIAFCTGLIILCAYNMIFRESLNFAFGYMTSLVLLFPFPFLFIFEDDHYRQLANWDASYTRIVSLKLHDSQLPESNSPINLIGTNDNYVFLEKSGNTYVVPISNIQFINYTKHQTEK